MGLDQFGNAMALSSAVTWRTSSGTITSGGLLTAAATGGNTIAVTAYSGSAQGSQIVMIAGVPTVATAAAAASSAVTGTTVALSVLGAFDGGESNLKYTWTASSPAVPCCRRSAPTAPTAPRTPRSRSRRPVRIALRSRLPTLATVPSPAASS